MHNVTQTDKLQAEIREKSQGYNRLLDVLQNILPQNHAELFSMKRKLILISREKTRLVEEFKLLTSK
jgi:hypothetical protein